MAERQPIVEGLVAEVRWLHETMLETIDALPADDFDRRVGPKAPSIAFHLWHTARWADRFHAEFPRLAGGNEPRDEIWTEEGLSVRWGLSGALGDAATGTGLDDDESSTLVLPAAAEVRRYAEAAFRAMEETYRSVRDDELLAATTNLYDEEEWTVLEHFGWHLAHGNRHLGMIEALRGVLGAEGTATT